jgi:hypothetical protein
MPAADRGVEEILKCSVAGSGADDRRRRRIEVPVRVDDCLGTKAAHDENQKDDLHPDPEGLAPGDASAAAAAVPPGKRPQFAHLKSPLLDERRLEKRFDAQCETGHAGWRM